MEKIKLLVTNGKDVEFTGELLTEIIPADTSYLGINMYSKLSLYKTEKGQYVLHRKTKTVHRSTGTSSISAEVTIAQNDDAIFEALGLTDDMKKVYDKCGINYTIHVE